MREILAENSGKTDFTIYLEGHEGHQGNVLARTFITKVQRLILVLNKLERTFIVAGKPADESGLGGKMMHLGDSKSSRPKGSSRAL